MKKTSLVLVFLLFGLTISKASYCNKKRIIADTSYQEMMFIIKTCEGYSDEVYKCSANVSTRGWGITKIELKEFNKQNKSNYKWGDLDNLKSNNEFLIKVTNWRYSYLAKKYPKLDARTLRGLVSFTFNVGNACLEKPIMKAALKVAHINKTPLCLAIKKYVYVKKGKLQGLVKRRNLECALIKGDITKDKLSELQKSAIP